MGHEYSGVLSDSCLPSEFCRDDLRRPFPGLFDDASKFKDNASALYLIVRFVSVVNFDSEVVSEVSFICFLFEIAIFSAHSDEIKQGVCFSFSPAFLVPPQASYFSTRPSLSNNTVVIIFLASFISASSKSDDNLNNCKISSRE
jgi:hypothetical protein